MDEGKIHSKQPLEAVSLAYQRGGPVRVQLNEKYNFRYKSRIYSVRKLDIPFHELSRMCPEISYSNGEIAPGTPLKLQKMDFVSFLLKTMEKSGEKSERELEQLVTAELEEQEGSGLLNLNGSQNP